MNYYCHFCNQRCTKMYPTSSYWNCKPCDVKFYERDNSQPEIIFHLFKDDESFYEILVDLEAKDTRIYLYYPVKLSNDPGVYDLPCGKLIIKTHLMGLTPTNLKTKIQTVLTFL